MAYAGDVLCRLWQTAVSIVRICALLDSADFA
jgi:hypothetical protein